MPVIMKLPYLIRFDVDAGLARAEQVAARPRSCAAPTRVLVSTMWKTTGATTAQTSPATSGWPIQLPMPSTSRRDGAGSPCEVVQDEAAAG